MLGVIGSQSGDAPKELFEFLSVVRFFEGRGKENIKLTIKRKLQLCSAPTSADVQTFALDELLQAMIDNLKSDEEKIAAVDFGSSSLLLLLLFLFVIVVCNFIVFSSSLSSFLLLFLSFFLQNNTSQPSA